MQDPQGGTGTTAMRTDYLGLEAFVAIADLGSFHRAADFLNLSQTALSHRVRKLETALGVALFNRTTREVSLTQEAQAMLPEIRRSLQALHDACGAMAETGARRSGRLAFACLPTLSYHYLPHVLRAFSDDYPDIIVRLEDRTVARVYELVQAGDVEFGITIVGAQQWDMEIRAIYTEPYVLYVRQDDPLARQPSVTRADLAGRTFARITTQSSNRQLVDEALEEYRDRYVWRYQVQNAATALSLVSEGAAITILPALMSRLDWKGLVALPFSDVSLSRTLGVVTRRGTTLTAPAQHLIGLLEDRLADRAAPVTAPATPRG
jgi:DNA-binding transcriptional LysR family regulator